MRRGNVTRVSERRRFFTAMVNTLAFLFKRSKQQFATVHVVAYKCHRNDINLKAKY